jgi:hypothetical protein
MRSGNVCAAGRTWVVAEELRWHALCLWLAGLAAANVSMGASNGWFRVAYRRSKDERRFQMAFFRRGWSKGSTSRWSYSTRQKLKGRSKMLFWRCIFLELNTWGRKRHLGSDAKIRSPTYGATSIMPGVITTDIPRIGHFNGNTQPCFETIGDKLLG